MKTSIILSAIITLMLSANVYGSERVVLKNEEKTEFGKQEVKIISVEETGMLDKKILNDYDIEGKLISRIAYEWTVFNGWVPVNKYEYGYGSDNEVLTVLCTKWNKKRNNWETKSEEMYYKTSVDGSVSFTIKVLKNKVD